MKVITTVIKSAKSALPLLPAPSHNPSAAHLLTRTQVGLRHVVNHHRDTRAKRAPRLKHALHEKLPQEVSVLFIPSIFIHFTSVLLASILNLFSDLWCFLKGRLTTVWEKSWWECVIRSETARKHTSPFNHCWWLGVAPRFSPVGKNQTICSTPSVNFMLVQREKTREFHVEKVKPSHRKLSSQCGWKSLDKNLCNQTTYCLCLSF